MSVIYRSIMSSMSIRVASGVLLMAILASSDVVNPVNNPVNSLTGEPLVLGFTSCVDFYDTACVWSYGNPDAVFLSFDTYDRRIDVLSMGKRWEFTNPQNPCSGGIQVINSTVNDSGSYWMRKGDGSDLHTSETVYANVLEEEHLMYVIQVNGEACNFSVSDGLLQTFPQIQPGDLDIRVVFGAGFPNSTTYTVKRSGEQACVNNTGCTIHVDAHSMDDTLVVLDTDISGANQITIVIPLDQSTKPASANVPAILLGVILVFVIGAVAGFVIWRKKKRQNRRRTKTSSEEATPLPVQPTDKPIHAQG